MDYIYSSDDIYIFFLGWAFILRTSSKKIQLKKETP